jgi:hypothetical protein
MCLHRQPVKFKLNATDEQLAAFESHCETMETLMANNLAKRIEKMPAHKSAPLIREWFRSVRDATVANWLISEMEATATPCEKKT